MCSTMPIENAVYTISRIDPRSTALVNRACRAIPSAIQGRSNWPTANGNNSCSRMSRIALASIRVPPLVFISSTTSNGVSAIPTMLDSDALTSAPETFPRAIDVKAIEDWTVDGTRHRNSSPLYRSRFSSQGTRPRAASPSNGKTTKVVAKTSRCSCHRLTPCQACCGDSRAPYSQNSSAITTLAATDTTSEKAPRAGNSAASATVAAMASRKVSIGSAESFFSTGVYRSVAGQRAGCAGPAAGGRGLFAAKCVARGLIGAGGDGTEGADDAHADHRQCGGRGCSQCHCASGGQHDRAGQLRRCDRAHDQPDGAGADGTDQRPQSEYGHYHRRAHAQHSRDQHGATIRGRSGPGATP